MTEPKTVSHLADQSAQHFLRDLKIDNVAATNRPVHFNATRLAAQKLQRLVANANDLAIIAIERHNRRLVQDDPFAGLIDECVDCAQIYSKLIPEKFFDKLHGDGSSSNLAGF